MICQKTQGRRQGHADESEKKGANTQQPSKAGSQEEHGRNMTSVVQHNTEQLCD